MKVCQTCNCVITFNHMECHNSIDDLLNAKVEIEPLVSNISENQVNRAMKKFKAWTENDALSLSVLLDA